MPNINYLGTLVMFLGGLGLFVYGMSVMSAGLQKSALSRMKSIMETVIKNKPLAILAGFSVTAIIQSSTATTVMVVGFVNAGILTLTQSVGVIMGANIGTTLTSWIVASGDWMGLFSPTTMSPVFIAVGTMLMISTKKDGIRQIGEICAGFGILFLGLSTMSDSVRPLRDLPAFVDMFATFGANPLLGILVGALVTAVVQSSTASVTILQSLVVVGLPWNAAVYIIMGQNIGTCLTAVLSSMGANKNAKAAAYVHLLFNVITSVVFSIVAITYFNLIDPIFALEHITMGGISIVHTVFSIAGTMLLYPFSNVLVNMATSLSNLGKTAADDANESETVHLDNRVLNNPVFAIQSSEKEIMRLGNMALDNLKLSTQALCDRDISKIDKIVKKETDIDILSHAITDYLVKVYSNSLTQADNNNVTSLFHIVTDIERVGDHCENIAELIELANETNANFSDIAQTEMRAIIDLTIKSFGDSVRAFEHGDKELAQTVIATEEEIDVLESQYRSQYIARLSKNSSNATAGVVFLDMLTNLERISDHACNIAEAVINK